MFGLSFLNTFFLWGMAAAALPIIIHLIKRNRAVKLPFAAMRFLQLKPNQKVKSQKLRQLLLLLMRITALALLALAFARPFFENADADSIWGTQQKAAVILVDNSYSMGYGDTFNSAIEKAQDLLRTFNPGDRVAVMKFSENAEIVAEPENEFGTTASQLNQLISLSNRSTNYLPAIQSAESFLLHSPLTSKDIYLISDFQKTGLTSAYTNWKVEPGIRLHFVEIEKENFSNISIKEVHISEQKKSGRNKDVLVRVTNFGAEKKKTSVILNINDRKISQRKITLLANEEKIIQFNKVRMPAGLVTGYVDIQTEEEKITQDNQFFFLLENNTRTQILAVNGEPNTRDVTRDELFFVDRAVNLPELAKYTLVKSKADRISNFDFSDYQSVILANIKDIGRTTLEQLKYYVRGGGGLILALGDQVNPTIFNRLFQDLSPASITNKAFNSINRENSVILADVDYQHPIFMIFANSGHGDPSTAQFYQYYHTSPSNSNSVLAYFDDASPAFLERQIGAGKVILFTSSFDTEWNNLPVKAIFLPILYQTLQYVASEKKGHKSYLVGQPVSLNNLPVGEIADGQLSVQLPSGSKVDLDKPIFNRTYEPGIYQIQRKGKNRKPDYFAVNVDTKESDLTPLDLADFQKAVLEDSEQEIQSVTIIPPKFNEQQERHQKLWRFVVLGIIILLVGETWLANRTYR